MDPFTNTPATDFAFGPALRARIVRHLDTFPSRQLASDGLRHAAVGVVVLADANAQACFVITRRLSTLRRHAGQWALPGGRLEAGETTQAAARREIHEEIDLDLPADAVLGRLDDFVTRSGHLISPHVLWAPGQVSVVASPDEVDSAFRVPLHELDHPRALQRRPLLHFVLPTLPSDVHAPTAAILFQFREVALHGREVRVADVEQPFFAWS